MAREIELKVLGGLPVTIAYRRNYREDWEVVAINGRYVKNPQWLYRRLDASDGANERIREAIEDDLIEAAFEYDDGR